MLKLSRHFATRLRGVFGNPTGTFARSTGRDGGDSLCEHLRRHLTSAHAAAPERTCGAREHELATETARRLITLVGQNGRAVARCLGAFDTETLARPSGVLLLHLAERVGDASVREAFGEFGAEAR
jgi:hypothetical protein